MPRVCSEGQCLVNIGGCYEYGTDCGNKGYDNEITETEGNNCAVHLVGKWLGECCDEGIRLCCPTSEDYDCYPTKGNCKCEPPKKRGIAVIKTGYL